MSPAGSTEAKQALVSTSMFECMKDQALVPPMLAPIERLPE